MTPVIKHATSSVFLFTPYDVTPDRGSSGWRIGLIRHPRLGRWMLPGGHVEEYENPAEAALREVAEETGLHARLVSPSGIGAPGLHTPWWMVEQHITGESGQPLPHVHVDHLYLALVDDHQPARTSELPFRWYDSGDLDSLHMFPDSRSRAYLLFDHISGLADHLG